MKIGYENEFITGEIKKGCELEVLKHFSEAMPARIYSLIYADEFVVAEMQNGEIIYLDYNYFC